VSEGGPMLYVYIVESESSPGRYYVGSTKDIQRRVDEHNEGKSAHTAKYRPWKLATYIAFENRGKAFKFEQYLKSGSGRAFSKKHF
jgi:putative endonuclease